MASVVLTLRQVHVIFHELISLMVPSWSLNNHHSEKSWWIWRQRHVNLQMLLSLELLFFSIPFNFLQTTPSNFLITLCWLLGLRLILPAYLPNMSRTLCCIWVSILSVCAVIKRCSCRVWGFFMSAHIFFLISWKDKSMWFSMRKWLSLGSATVLHQSYFFP